jgi:dienelactone hydrolase
VRRSSGGYLFCLFMTVCLCVLFSCTDIYSAGVELQVSPLRAPLDTPVTITVSGLQPAQTATLRARMADEDGNPWSSLATFNADKNGMINPSRQAPYAGTYGIVSPMGLIWSLTAERAGTLIYGKNTLEPMSIDLSLEVEGKTIAVRNLQRLSIPDTVIMEHVKKDGLVGIFFRPNSGGPHPGVILFNGSGGGLWVDQAANLAAHGYATFALGVFGADGLPDRLNDIPLEYFEKGIGWMNGNPAVEKGRLAVMGRSRGGELAVLLGSRFPDIKAVVAYAPSSVMTQGIPWDVDAPPPATWTWRGEALPCVAFKLSDADMSGIVSAAAHHRSVATDVFYAAGMEDAEAAAKAAIAVEKTGGAILLISGDEDRVWPSTQFCRMMVDRLKNHNFPHPYRHLRYQGAGHDIALPYEPTTIDVSLDRASGMLLAHGGSAEDNAFAREDSWQKVLMFLKENLRQ